MRRVSTPEGVDLRVRSRASVPHVNSERKPRWRGTVADGGERRSFLWFAYLRFKVAETDSGKGSQWLKDWCKETITLNKHCGFLGFFCCLNICHVVSSKKGGLKVLTRARDDTRSFFITADLCMLCFHCLAEDLPLISEWNFYFSTFHSKTALVTYYVGTSSCILFLE